MDPAQRELQVGDFVTIAGGANPLTWTIREIHKSTELDLELPEANDSIAVLISGNSGRMRRELLRNLTRFIGRKSPMTNDDQTTPPATAADPDKGEVLSVWATLNMMTAMASLTNKTQADDE